jgi:hypothetical protein
MYLNQFQFYLFDAKWLTGPLVDHIGLKGLEASKCFLHEEAAATLGFSPQAGFILNNVEGQKISSTVAATRLAQMRSPLDHSQYEYIFRNRCKCTHAANAQVDSAGFSGWPDGEYINYSHSGTSIYSAFKPLP